MDYMDDICTLVSRCRNLESLGLKGTQYCNLESLVWRPTKDGLRSLDLHRATMTSSTLFSLLSPSTGFSESASTSKIVSVKLSDVELQDASLSTIFDHLGSSPLLADVEVKGIVMGRNDRRSVVSVIKKMNARKG